MSSGYSEPYLDYFASRLPGDVSHIQVTISQYETPHTREAMYCQSSEKKNFIC